MKRHQAIEKAIKIYKEVYNKSKTDSRYIWQGKYFCEKKLREQLAEIETDKIVNFVKGYNNEKRNMI